MTVKRNDPFRNLIAIQEQLHRLLIHDFQEQANSTGWLPPVDIYESDDRYILQAEVPGMNDNDIQIHIHDNQLQLFGERKSVLTGAEKYHLAETPRGEFSRKFQFPVPIQSDKVKARLADGILTVELPKLNADELQRVEIT